MSNDFMKMAVVLAVAAPVFTTGVQNHWFARGAEALHKLTAPGLDAQQPAHAAVNIAQQKARAAQTGWGLVELTADGLNQYQTDIEINGVRIHALVDTGASHIFMTSEDARALNFDPPRSAYTATSSTANGMVRNAPVQLNEVRVGSIVVRDIDAFVAQPGAQQITLLGMSFLKKLSSFQVADGRFVMKQ
jgi:aspartyl protease family protein